MTLDDLYPLYDADRGTLSTAGQRSFLKEVQAQGLTYAPYAQRVGPGFATAASELKRALDASVLPAFQDVVGRVTSERFTQAYCDVRLYPQGQELAHWSEGHWEGERLTVMVAFVLSIPPNDSLDSMARASLLSLFEESSWDPQVKKLGKKGKLRERLNVDAVNAILSDMVFEGFNPYDLDGFELEIMIDGCPAARYERLRTSALGEPIQKARSTRTVFKGMPAPITLDNAAQEVPVLIAALAKALGVKHLNPAALQPGDSLYALMGFDDKLTKSLAGSIRMHFDVLTVVGGPGMFTVGDAITFAQEILESRQDD
ncbi:MAG: hypothetical protein RL522_1695 [Pseudomonadota bacterium]